jgi:hypothetical protein
MLGAWVVGLIVVLGLGVSGVVVGSIALSRLDNGVTTPTVRTDSLFVGGNPIVARRGAARQQQRTDGSSSQLVVSGDTVITGTLQVDGRMVLPPPDCSGTTLQNAQKTATGTLTQVDTYTWTVVKTLLTPNVTADNDQCATLVHHVEATRALASTTYVYGVTGTITVTNGGAVATQGLSIVDSVERNCGGGTGFLPYAGPFAVDVSANPVLDPGETGVYPYTLTLAASAPSPSCAYRNSVNVTILNHSGALPGCPQCAGPLQCAFGPNPKVGFTFPSTPSAVQQVHETVALLDVANSNAGYTCTVMPVGGALLLVPCPVDDAECVDYCTFSADGGNFVQCDIYKEVCNAAAQCDTYSDFCDYVRLTSVNETAPLVRTSNTVCAGVYSGTCATGCTLTIGYWKTHAGFHGQNADRVTQYLPITLGSTVPNGINVTTAAQSSAILAFNGDASNGLNKLAAQLLGVRYNQLAEGASIAAISANVTAADALLGTHGVSRTTWNALSNGVKNTIRALAAALDAYNNGVTGPGHCE